MVTEYTNVPAEKSRRSAVNHSLDSISGAVDAATKVWEASQILETTGLRVEAAELRDIAMGLDRLALGAPREE